ncbi:hypothetical protein TNCT_252231 [Trichonephila clavata]|uniref:Uncharacterized protein n=1 Tax=Trichonephila clavata TaxID=2740835 RepID=A0A8X6JJE9_TRICU|nr:hypothetical protein TNCT_252231 [Trichonephila clavata]
MFDSLFLSSPTIVPLLSLRLDKTGHLDQEAKRPCTPKRYRLDLLFPLLWFKIGWFCDFHCILGKRTPQSSYGHV